MRLLQTQDVASRLGVAASTVRRWAAEGRLPYRWAGTYRVFEPSEVRRLAGMIKSMLRPPQALPRDRDRTHAE